MVRNTILCRPIAGTLQKDHGLRQVVVFGAGVSKGLGVPLAKELLKEMVAWSETCMHACMHAIANSKDICTRA